jgi:hypothetical protein
MSRMFVPQSNTSGRYSWFEEAARRACRPRHKKLPRNQRAPRRQADRTWSPAIGLAWGGRRVVLHVVIQ